MEIPQQLRVAIIELVNDSLRAELDSRGLLLTRAAAFSATEEAERLGAALLLRLIIHLFPRVQPDGRATAIEFDNPDVTKRIALALTFGAVTARLLTTPQPPTDESHDPDASLDLLCAMFNLGIGLVDGVCDGTPALGRQLLREIRASDVSAAARKGWTRDRMLSALPTHLASDPTVVFTARVIEGFFDLLHSRHPVGHADSLRHRIGALMEQALEAESQSVCRTAGLGDVDQMVEWSRRTSVLPFQVIEHLATGAPNLAPVTAGTLLGEAMWRIDDLVDLADDAASGSLNAVLLNMRRQWGTASTPDVLTKALTSGVIPLTAAHAVQLLDSGLAAASGSGTPGEERDVFVSFVQRYAGIPHRDGL